MSKLSSLFHFRNQLSRRKLCAHGMSNAILFPSVISTAGSVARQTFSTDASGKLTSRVFAEYYVYKGKAALAAKPVLPTFSRTNSGDLKLDRQGIILLTISPAIGERKYDWEKKQYFALSPTEIGSLISLESTNSCEFFHAPSMNSSNAGKVRKSLSIRPHDGGYFFQLSVVNNILKSNDRFTIPITTAEFAVMRTAFSFALPHLMGWDQLTNQIPGTVQESSSKVVPASLDSEWNQ